MLIDHGQLAFDGDFARLRREFTDRRHLLLETPNSHAPQLAGAELIKSEGGRHEYTFEAANVSLTDLLAQASAQTSVLDVETHRALIDDVIADIYEKWQSSKR